jgi:hypothetical protein
MRITFLILTLLLAAGCATSDPGILRDQIELLGDTLAKAVERDPAIQSIAVTSVKGEDPALSLWFSRALESELVARPSFVVLDRENLDRILAEHELVLSDVFDDSRRPGIGRLLGADGLVISEIQPNPDLSFYALRGRLIHLETGRIVVSGSATLAADDLDFSEGKMVDQGGGGVFATAGNVLLALLKLPATPVTMFLDIFETACTNERGAGTRVSHSYPERVLTGFWEGIPIPFPWVGGVFDNDLYLTRDMWNAWF